jgi:hypothetical protein
MTVIRSQPWQICFDATSTRRSFPIHAGIDRSKTLRQCKKLKETLQQLEEPEEEVAKQSVELVCKINEQGGFPLVGSPAAGLNPMLR